MFWGTEAEQLLTPLEQIQKKPHPEVSAEVIVSVGEPNVPSAWASVSLHGSFLVVAPLRILDLLVDVFVKAAVGQQESNEFIAFY